MGSSDGQLRVGVPEEPFGSQGDADGAGVRVCVCVRARVCVCDICPWLWGLEQFCIEVARCARWLRARWFGKRLKANARLSPQPLSFLDVCFALTSID